MSSAGKLIIDIEAGVARLQSDMAKVRDTVGDAVGTMGKGFQKLDSSVLRMQGNFLKLAGAGSLLVWYRQHAEATEKWRDEMANLDRITNQFFADAAKSGQLDPLVNVTKAVTLAAMGGALAIETLGKGIATLGAAAALVASGEFRLAGEVFKQFAADAEQSWQRLGELKDRIFTEAPQGAASQKSAWDFGPSREDMEQLQAELLAKRKEYEDRLFDIGAWGNDQQNQLTRKYVSDYLLLNEARAARVIETDRALNEYRLALAAQYEAALDGMRIAREQKQAEAYNKEIASAADALASLQQSLMTQEQLELQSYERRQFALMEALQWNLLTQQEFEAMEADLKLQHEARLGDVESQGILARRRFAEMSAKQQTKTVLGELLALTNGVATHSKSMFRLNQMAGIANAIINTSEGVTRALAAYPPPLSFAMAAAQFAAGMAQVNAIRSASFGGGTSAPSVGGGAAVPVTPASSAAEPAGVTQPQRNITIVLQGNGLISQEWLRDQLAPAMQQAAGDGVSFSVA